MPHRYGRHGPRAWLRWQKRHTRPPVLPVPVRPEIRVIRVPIPMDINVERIIYIIMAKDGQFVGTSDEEPGDENTLALQHYRSGIPSSLDAGSKQSVVAGGKSPAVDVTDERASADVELQESAKIAAVRDLRSFERAREEGRGVLVDLRALTRRAENVADYEVYAYRARHPDAVSSAEYDRLFTVYIQTYQAKIRERLSGEPDVSWGLEDRKEAELRLIAIQDRDVEQTSGVDRRLSHHRRDLGVLRVIALYGIDVMDVLAQVEDGNVESLERMHQIIDRYDAYQQRAGNEVKWPTEATFQ